MKRIAIVWLAVGVSAAAMSGCYSVKAVDRASEDDLIAEGSVVFARAGQYTLWFGSHSPREYFEVVYERFSYNDAGMPVVEVGIRYRGDRDLRKIVIPAVGKHRLRRYCGRDAL